LIRKLILGVLTLLLVFSVGCSDGADNISSGAIKDNSQEALNNETNDIDSSKPNYETESNTDLQNDYEITKDEAVRIAFAEAKKHEAEFNLIIEDNAISNYTCELKEKDGVELYDIIFKDIPLNRPETRIKTQIGIWVNANTGEIIKAMQYK